MLLELTPHSSTAVRGAELQDDHEPKVLAFSGPATIRQVTESCAQLKAALAGGEAVRLDLSAVSACDVSFVQLLESARRSSDRLRLAGPAAGALREVLERGGFLEGCTPDQLHFWTHAGAAQ